MSSSPTAVHGGEVWRIAKEYGVDESSLLDFSANINPRGLPLRASLQLQHDAADAAVLSRYPDPTYSELRGVLARQLGVPSECILVGEGAEALIGSVIRSVSPGHCLVPVPAFSEYARACTAANSKIATIDLVPESNFHLDRSSYKRGLRDAQCECAILNNPHNPSGVLLESGEVLELLKETHASSAFAMVDEAFIDYAPHASVVQYAAEHSDVAVIRSLTKFYGCPALRVGYLVASPDTVAKIARAVPTWPVTTLAANALREAIQDEEYASATLRQNEAERELLANSLSQLGARVFPSAANFLLLQLKPCWPNSRSTQESLIRNHRIVVRNCDSYSVLEAGKFIRVAVRTAAENARLLRGLQQVWE